MNWVNMEDFEKLAINEPQILIEKIKSSYLKMYELVYAIEAAGLIEDSNSIRQLLIPFLFHTNELIRESSLYGLSYHINDEVIDCIFNIIENDPNDVVVNVALQILSSMIWYKKSL